MCEKRAIATDGARQKDAAVFGDSVGDECRVEGLLRAINPDELPTEITDGKCVVVLYAKRSGIVEGAVAHHHDHRYPQRGRDRKAFERIHPAHTARPTKDARPYSGSVLYDFELGVLALGHNVFTIHLAVGDQLSNILDDRVVRTDRIARNHVNISQLTRNGDGLTAGDQRSVFSSLGCFRNGCRCHRNSPGEAQSPSAAASASGTCSSY